MQKQPNQKYLHYGYTSFKTILYQNGFSPNHKHKVLSS
jgi:hypothetical protein